MIYDPATKQWSWDLRLDSTNQDVSLDGQYGVELNNKYYLMNWDDSSRINYT